MTYVVILDSELFYLGKLMVGMDSALFFVVSPENNLNDDTKASQTSQRYFWAMFTKQKVKEATDCN